MISEQHWDLLVFVLPLLRILVNFLGPGRNLLAVIFGFGLFLFGGESSAMALRTFVYIEFG